MMKTKFSKIIIVAALILGTALNVQAQSSQLMQLSGSSPKKILERMTMLRDLSDTLL